MESTLRSDGAVALETVLRTEELRQRPARTPDYQAENRALTELAVALADSPRTVLQRLVEVALWVCRGDSAGVSLLSKRDGGQTFYWPAVTGALSAHVGGGTPRAFGPCGAVLDRKAPQLFVRPERYYPYLAPITPPLEEVLLTPFFVKGQAVGTIWLVSHRPERQFESEDLRLIESLGKFASAAHEMIEGLETLEGERAELRESELRFRKLVDALPAAVYTTDAAGRVTYYNQAAVDFSGRVPVLGSDQWCVNWKMYRPDGTPLPHDECPMAIALKEGRAVRGQPAIAERPDGSRIWFEPYPTPLHDNVGNVVGGINMLLDITERRKGQEATARLAAIVESSDDAIVSKNLDGIITSWNRGAERVFGYTADEAIGQPVTLLIPEDRWNEEPGILERIRRGEKIDHFETIRRRKDGTLLTVSLTVSPVRDAHGNIVGASKIARDISDRKRSEQRLRLLWEAAAVLLSADDPDVMMRGLFNKLSRYLGVDAYFNYLVNDAGDALQLVSSLGIPDETARAIERLEFGQAICGAVALHREPMVVEQIQESDDPRAELVKSFGIRAYACNPLLAENRLIGTLSFASRTKDRFDSDEVAVFETVCHYVAMAYERLRLVKQLQEADRRKDEFLATLAHELRNPLAPVRNALQLLRQADGDTALIEQASSIMERQVSQMVRLIDDLLDVARITRDKLELRKERTDLATIVENAVEASRPLIAQMRHDLLVTLPEELVSLDADPVRLTQVFLNLLNNSAKYTEPGGHIWVTTEVTQRMGEPAEVAVTVKDTGVGIPADKLPHVFDLFTQVERSLDRSQGGLGLGLTLVKRLTEMHGGSVEAFSGGPGQGSAFTVRLPAIVGAVNGATPPSNSSATVASRHRLLVVDDNRDGADSLATMLRMLGNRVQTAYDGIEAAQMAEGFRPDVVLLDIGLPKLNGYEACHRIRRQPWGRDMVVIAVTGWGQEEDKSRSQEAGFDFHMVKPVNPADLQRLLSNLMPAPVAG